MEFEEYLTQKKIDAQKFKSADLVTFLEWKQDFQFINEDSFTVLKKFVINKTRRKYPLN
ncbi:MAG: hypothetical protein LCH67_05805 [Bacteroidetes bacterium]|nr:hypothetical protein [Bacteroidota bacterium]